MLTLVENSCIDLTENLRPNLDPSQSIAEQEAAEIKSTFTAGLCPIAAIASVWDSQKVSKSDLSHRMKASETLFPDMYGQFTQSPLHW